MDQDLEYIDELGADEEEKSMIQAMKVALYNNLAACYLSINDLANARAACDEALLLDPSQAKALYRRAKAWISDINSGADEFKLAIEDLKKALELSPNDSAIYQTLVKAKQDLVKVKASTKSFQGMFNKPSKNDDTTETKDETPKSQTEPEKKEEVQTKPEETVPVAKPEKKIEEPKKDEEKVKVQPEKKVEDIKEKEKERLIVEEQKYQEKKVVEQKSKSPKEENKTEKVKKEKEPLRLYEDKDEDDKNKENKVVAPEKPDEIKELEQYCFHSSLIFIF